MRKFAGIVLSLAILALGSSAFASDDLSVQSVDAFGSTTPKTSFAPGETPFVHVHLPHSGLNFVSSFWNSPAPTVSHFASYGPSTDQDIWLSLSNWNTVQKVGTWNVNASYLFAEANGTGSCTGTCGAGQTSFTVTPEPTSAMLFMTGGLALAAGFRRRRKSARL